MPGAVEGGYRFTDAATRPWLRAGWFRSSEDTNAADNKRGTFFQLLPTPRVHARIPVYNRMNSTDEFVQVIDQPAKKVAIRSNLHWLQLEEFVFQPPPCGHDYIPNLARLGDWT